MPCAHSWGPKKFENHDFQHSQKVKKTGFADALIPLGVYGQGIWGGAENACFGSKTTRNKRLALEYHCTAGNLRTAGLAAKPHATQLCARVQRNFVRAQRNFVRVRKVTLCERATQR